MYGKVRNIALGEEPVRYDTLTKKQFDAEIEKGMDDIRSGRVYSADEVEAEMKQDFEN